MQSKKKRSAAAFLSLLALLILAIAIWHFIVYGAAVWLVARVVANKHGWKRRRRPKSSWSSLGRTAALMFAAWNSRWLKPTSPIKASIPKKVGAERAPAADFGEVPF